MHGIKAAIVEAALAAGAGAVRFAPAAFDRATFERMQSSFERGDLATWAYGEPYAQRAASPGALLADAQSVVCLAVAYAAPAPPGRAPLSGRVSVYAWGEDYHGRLRRVAHAVAEEIDRIAGAPSTHVVCDTAPLAERAFAAMAGLGWVGKHTNLIAAGLGSYVFLAEIVTTLRLEPDAPLKKTCGACTRCVDACPTRALRGDYTIDATRCIADLTQRTDDIPVAWRPFVGDWVWGCDLCQEVCPPTRLAGSQPASARGPSAPEEAFPDLQRLLRLRSSEFKRRYRRRALGWRGAAVLRRNAAVALGNSLDRSAVEALEVSLANDPHAMVRGHAAWALGRLGSPRALASLRLRRGAEADARVRGEIDRALASWETFGMEAPLTPRRNLPK